ncbi:alpha/beta fold hydrolase [Caenimonas sedimenti]|uniref:alpha/beta fold hydrolase n=1 Tax=Caenimonas sedimenti TaxID=2596921 RepID=UPI001C964169|nr:hypothetical protein [Caenimonas sedimenti]
MTLVLLPGMDGTGELFAPFIAAYGGATQVVRYPPTAVLNYAGLEEVARSALPRGEPFVLLGESFSGPIAISLAASRPPNLLGVILCCTFARNPRPFLGPFRSLLPMLLASRPFDCWNLRYAAASRIQAFAMRCANQFNKSPQPLCVSA